MSLYFLNTVAMLTCITLHLYMKSSTECLELQFCYTKFLSMSRCRVLTLFHEFLNFKKWLYSNKFVGHHFELFKLQNIFVSCFTFYANDIQIVYSVIIHFIICIAYHNMTTILWKLIFFRLFSLFVLNDNNTQVLAI